MFLKKLKFNSLVVAIAYVFLGLLLTFFPAMTTAVVCNILAVALLVSGVAVIIDYFKSASVESKSNGLAIGLFAILIAVFLFFQAETVLMVIPVFLGFAILVSGAIKAQNAIMLMRMKQKEWPIALIAALVCFVLGELVIFNPFAVLSTLMLFMGISLIVSGLSDIALLMLLTKKVKDIRKAA